MAYRPYIWRKNNPDKRLLQKKREKIRRHLRERGILPKTGEPMNEEQQTIFNQISDNDFSYWDSIKKKKGHDGGIQTYIRIKSPEYLIWYRAKSNAKDRRYEFNLEISDIIIPEVCPYLGIKILTDVNSRTTPNYYSIDRINSSKGYVKGNVQVISLLANTMKNNATTQELITFAQNILKMYNS
jgi:hypothetical protein